MARMQLKVGIGITCIILAMVLVFLAKSVSDSPGVEKISSGSRRTTDAVRNAKSGHGTGVPHTGGEMAGDRPQEPRRLDLPAPPVDGKSVEEPTDAVVVTSEPRRLRSDDDILALGGVVPAAAKPAASDDKTTRLKSIKSEDWKGAANLLVNALRVGEGFEVNHDQLLAFISGRDLLGWPESYRNWIGDELMTALRQDMPERAFADLQSVQENQDAPAAMRDYAVQHLGHLIADGVAGAAGVDYLRQVLAQNDPVTAGTALVTLHRLCDKTPEWIQPGEVRKAAEARQDTTDERLKITVTAILAETQGK